MTSKSINPQKKENSIYIPKKLNTYNQKEVSLNFQSLSSINNKLYDSNKEIKNNPQISSSNQSQYKDLKEKSRTIKDNEAYDEMVDIKKVLYNKQPKLNIDKLISTSNKLKKDVFLTNINEDEEKIEISNNVSCSLVGDGSIVNNNEKNMKLLLKDNEKDVNSSNTYKNKRLLEIIKQRSAISNNETNNKIELSNLNKSSNYLESDIDKSDYSGLSSASELDMKRVNIYKETIYTFKKIERNVLPNSVGLYLKNKPPSQKEESSNTNQNFNVDCFSFDDLHKRYGKLLDKTLLIYQNDVSQQLTTSIDLTSESYIEIGPVFLLEKKEILNSHQQQSQTHINLFSFNIYSHLKCYSLYCLTYDDLQKWVKAINHSIGFYEIDDLYVRSSQISSKEGIKIEKCMRKSDGYSLILKTYSKSMLNQEKTELISREVTILRSLKHPYILKFHEKFDNHSSIFLLTEYCKGYDLNKYFNKYSLSLSEAHICRIAFQICCAVSYIHSYGILHRNIKNENILISDETVDGNVRLKGFNYALFLNNPSNSQDSSHDFKGTLRFSAPEVILRQAQSYESDIWSIGVVLYILFTRKFPFDGKDNYEICDNIINTDPFERDSLIWEDYSKESRLFVGNLLNKRYYQRMNFIEILDFSWFYMWNSETE